jgi:uncharacterized protein
VFSVPPKKSNSKTDIIKGRCIVESARKISGPVLFSSFPIAFLQGVDPERGVVSDKKSDIYNEEFRGKILIFPNAIGSSVGAYVIYRMVKNRTAPLAMIARTADIITASGCALSGIPLYDVSEEYFDILKKFDKITIEGKTGIIRRFGSRN